MHKIKLLRYDIVHERERWFKFILGHRPEWDNETSCPTDVIALQERYGSEFKIHLCAKNQVDSERTSHISRQMEIDAELDLAQYQFVTNNQNKGSKSQPAKLPVSKRSPVENIKTLWQQETLFSDWLVTQEGIDLLAEDLEIAIENPRREGKGENFSCDIVANIVGDRKSTRLNSSH